MIWRIQNSHTSKKKVMFTGTTLQNRTSRSDDIINIPYARVIFSISTILLMFFRDVTRQGSRINVRDKSSTSPTRFSFNAIHSIRYKKIAHPINILESEFTYYTSSLVVKSLELHIGRSLGPRNSISGAVIILALVNSLWDIVVPHFCDDP